MKKILLATFVFVFSFQTIAFCQTDSTVIKNAVSKLQTLLTDHIAEKAYLHFDRPYLCYVAGDVVYFKAYVIKGERHEPTNISGILHVDLIDKNNVILQSEQLQLNYGVGWGDFSLPDTLKKGSYRIRAYTNWMRNEKEPDFFEQYISVTSLNNADRVLSPAIRSKQPSLQFFPEGGNLVTDIRTKMAFKAIGPNGLGIDVKGIVIDDQNKEVATITSAHLGMGEFDFLPETGRKYTARVTFADGSKNTLNLPDAEEKGIALSVSTDDPAKLSVTITANRAYYKENQNKQLNLLIYGAGSIQTIVTKLDNGVLGLDLPTVNLKSGILQVSLLSQTGEPLCERMAFIQNPDQLNLSLSTDKTIYAKRENVELNLNAKTNTGSIARGSFSVSVVDESKILADENSESTILSYFLLTSDLKGYIEKPNYYFANVTKQTRTDLDILMLTQGYRRFTWKQLLMDNANSTANYSPEQYLDIAGALTTKTGTPLEDTKVILLPLGLTQKTDTKGHFEFSKVNFQANTQLILKANVSAFKTAVVLTMNNPMPPADVNPVDPVMAKYNTTADILAVLQNNSSQGVVMANNGTSTLLLKGEKYNGPVMAATYKTSSLAGPGHADQVIDGNTIKNAPILSSGLNGLARGIDFIQGVPYLRGSSLVGNNSSYINAMMIVVDGTVLPIGSTVDDVNPVTVETVEILKGNNATIYGENSNVGVIVITTKQGDNDVMESKESLPGIFSIKQQGFYKAREFYSPVYDVNQDAGKVPDQRVTIFWKPDVSTDANGNAALKFFNADGTGTYRVVVEGIDVNGNLGRQVYRYKVQ